MTRRIPRIAVTPGEPAGIGPDLCLTLIQQQLPVELVAFCDPGLLSGRAALLGYPLRLRRFDPAIPPRSCEPGELLIQPVPLSAPADCGSTNPANARYVLDTLEQAAESCLQQDCAALVTGPVHKAVINDAGIPFSGHTEFLADYTHCDDVVMLLVTPGLRVALVTTHLPLSGVSQAITRERLERVISVLYQGLQIRLGIEKPRILVCGLNPHAGEGGHLGREEIDVIAPTLSSLRETGMDLIGPLPADTVFTPRHLGQGDAVLAMYHDQGLPVLKHMGFGTAVNTSLGLPFIRTSVDHGTALHLAGSGQADAGSMKAALQMAIDMASLIDR